MRSTTLLASIGSDSIVLFFSQFACFDTNCNGVFRTPKGRRLHLIDKHKYPPNFYFAVTNYGIGRSLVRWGEGASLLRKEWKPRVGSDPHMDCSEGVIECTSEGITLVILMGGDLSQATLNFSTQCPLSDITVLFEKFSRLC